MKFLLMMAEEDHFAKWDRADEAERAAVVAAFEAFDAAVRERGSIVAGEALAPPDEARTVRPGHTTVTDGPYAETVEQVGGFYLIDVPDLETAVDLARLLPAPYSVEVRAALEVDFLSVTALEALLREEWGRLLALLVAQYRRLDLAEDGLGDAFEAAARTWPRDGTPDNPAAWLLTAARRRILDRLRAEAVAARKLPLLAVEAGLQEEAQRVMVSVGEPVRDERLRLVLLCAHPSLPPEGAAALTLRLVLGVPTEDVARLFLVPTPTMAARLTRARKRLADESFSVPSGPELVSRVAIVADVAYLAFTAGYAPGSGADVLRADVAGEAIRLVRVVRSLLPPSFAGAADLDALLALMLVQHSRRDARVAAGRLVLLPGQDRSRWRVDEAAEALSLLAPLVDAPASPYLLQALIAAEHAIAPSAADTDWARIAARYAELEELTGSPVVRLNRAVAVAEASDPQAGLALLDGLALPGHRLPATRAELLARSGRLDEARASYDEAIGRCGNLAERAHLIERRACL